MNGEIRQAAGNVVTCQSHLKRLELAMQLCRESGDQPGKHWRYSQEYTRWQQELYIAQAELLEAVMDALEMDVSIDSVIRAQLEAFGLNATVESEPGFAATADADFIEEVLTDEAHIREDK